MATERTVGVLGLGRLGKALVGGLTEIGLKVRRKDHTGSLAAWADACDVWCLAVRDDQIQPLVALLNEVPARGKTVLIHGGSVPLGVLNPLARRGAVTGKFHPLQSFSQGGEAGMPEGTPFAMEGDIEDLVAPWVTAWGGSLYKLSGDQWLAYHVAAVTAANFLPLFIRAGADILAPLCAGREDALAWLAPLVRRSVEGALWDEKALPYSGPAVRGDHQVMAAHQAWLERTDPELAGLYRVASQRIGHLAGNDVNDDGS